MEKTKSKQNKKLPKLHLKKEIRIKIDIEPYLKNFEKEKQYTIPIFIPHIGCNNCCVFCNQRKISGAVTKPTYEEVEKEIEKYLEYYKESIGKVKIEVAFFGGSFTGIDKEDQENYLKIANKYLKEKKITGIRLSTRPDYISPKILNRLKKYGVTTIELGVQSMNNKVLEASKRGHLAQDVIRASKLINIWGFNLGHQIMIGLPESSVETEKETINSVLKLKVSELRIYPVYVIEESELYDMYKEGHYIPLDIKEAVSRVLEVVKICTKSNIKIIRLGLQSTDEITINNGKIAGPICDNFAEYVISYIVKEKMEEEIINRKIDIGNIVTFEVKKKYTSFIVGPNKVNKKYFKEKYDIEIGVRNI